MEEQYYNLYEFMLSTKSIIYIMMGAILVLVLGFWAFLFGRDKNPVE
jgi:hypothetical protein